MNLDEWDDDPFDEIDHVEDAESYEQLADEFPGSRGFLLLNAAEAWIRAGRRDRAAEALTPVAGGSDDAARYARIELADIALIEDRRGDAGRLLAELARDRELKAEQCEIAAIVLTHHADWRGALRWYDDFAGRLAPARIAELRRPEVGLTDVRKSLQDRRDLRRSLGEPADALDDLIDGRAPRPQQVLVLQRSGADLDPDDVHYRVVERLCHAMAECGVSRVVIVPVLHPDAADAAPRTIAWPPPRNGACWCGSTLTYKRCCRAGR